ncbi:MAG: outer membrane beta-barrel protein [Chitinophagaceae bacterium]
MKKTLWIVSILLATTQIANAQIKLFQKKNKSANKSTKDSTAQQPAVQAPYAELLPTTVVKKDYSKLDLSNRPADHFMLQYGVDGWTGSPDSVNTAGFSRHFNFYFMLDKPFKNDKRFSIGFGAGIASSNIFFDKTFVDIKATGNRLPFTNTENGNSYEKFKLTSIFLEIPVEIRYYSNPEKPNKSWKFAAGAKVATLLKSYTKGKNLQNNQGASIYGQNYISKEYSKRFINGTRLSVSGRVGYGNVSLHGDFAITPVIRDGFGPAMNSYSIGVCFSGL